MKRILMLLLSFLLIFSVMLLAVSCGDDANDGNNDGGNSDNDENNAPCTDHIDEDEDGECDECGEELEEGDGEPQAIDITLKVRDQDGEAVVGVTFAFYENDNLVLTSLPSDANGDIELEIPEGSYSLISDTSSAEGYYLILTSSLTVTADKTVYDISVANNTPNGSEERPYPLTTEEENLIELSSGESAYYIVYKSVDLYVDIVGSGYTVNYLGTEYVPDGDSLTIPLHGDDYNSTAVLLVTNTLDEANSLIASVNSFPGTQGNPYVIENVGEEITLTIYPDTQTWYTYTASADGVFSINMITDNMNVNLQNNSTAANIGDTGIEVKSGDVVVITVSTTATGAEAVEIVFVPNFE